eukprot:411554-Amphidinium_carterae.1
MAPVAAGHVRGFGNQMVAKMERNMLVVCNTSKTSKASHFEAFACHPAPVTVSQTTQNLPKLYRTWLGSCKMRYGSYGSWYDRNSVRSSHNVP